MDDRFEKESTVYAKPEKEVFDPVVDWKDSVSAVEYFLKAFRSGKEDHPAVQKLRMFLPQSYDEVKKEFEK